MMIPLGLGATSSVLTDNIAQAIAQFEGYNQPGTVAVRNNNPGNLRAGPGQTGTDANGYAIFPDPATGWAALDHQVDLNISRGLTLNQFFAGEPGVYAGYAPSADSNNPVQYAAFVAQQANIPVDTPLNEISSPLPAPNADTIPADSTTFDTTVNSTAIAGISPTVLVIGAAVAFGLILIARR